MKVKTIVADNQPVLIEGLKQVLSTDDHYEFLITACNLEANWSELIPRLQPDLVILELKTPDADSIQVIRQLHKLDPHLRIGVFTRFEQHSLSTLVQKAGAHGLLLKTASLETVKASIIKMLNNQHSFPNGVEQARAHADDSLSTSIGEPLLTKREVQILQLISKAMSNKQIASQLYISYQTVSVHRKNIMRKLGVSNTAGLVRAAYDHCLV